MSKKITQVLSYNVWLKLGNKVRLYSSIMSVLWTIFSKANWVGLGGGGRGLHHLMRLVTT